MSETDYKILYEEMVESYSICFKGLKSANADATRLRGLVEAVNKYKKSRLITDRKAMFELAEELKPPQEQGVNDE